MGTLVHRYRKTMKLVENIKKTIKDSSVLGFPGTHAAAVTLLLAGLGIFSIIPENAEAQRSVGELALPPAVVEAIDQQAENQSALAEIDPPARKVALTVKPGDNLSVLFKRAGLNDTAMMNFIAAADESEKLASIKPKHDLIFALDAQNAIQSLTYVKSRLNKYRYVLDDTTYRFENIVYTPDVKRASRSGMINSSLYIAGQNAGLDDALIMKLAEIFGWDIDFALDIRKGDSFRILYEEKFLDGEKLGNGAILSAEFVNQGESFRAVRYVHADGGAQYYTPDGKSMRKAFLRAPVDFRRISSNFNPRRLHPVTKTVRPHRGIDYAAKTGTPVWSSGDGRVVESGYTRYNGNYVIIQHGNNVKTKYLHLHKRKVKKGQRIRQKQIIGTVGATGLVTGPHLHYEFLLNGVHRNPRTIVQKLPKAESISTALKADFKKQTGPIIAQLIEETSTQLAFSDANSTTTSL